MENRIEKIENDVNEVKERLGRVENDVNEVKESLGRVENDVSFLREEVRVGFHTLNDTLNTMFDLTAKSIRANKKVAIIMENAYSEATEEYIKIKKSKK